MPTEPTELDVFKRALLSVLQNEPQEEGDEPRVSAEEQRRIDAETRIQQRYRHYDGIGVDEDSVENGGPVSPKTTRLYIRTQVVIIL